MPHSYLTSYLITKVTSWGRRLGCCGLDLLWVRLVVECMQTLLGWTANSIHSTLGPTDTHDRKNRTGQDEHKRDGTNNKHNRTDRELAANQARPSHPRSSDLRPQNHPESRAHRPSVRSPAAQPPTGRPTAPSGSGRPVEVVRRNLGPKDPAPLAVACPRKRPQLRAGPPQTVRGGVDGAPSPEPQKCPGGLQR